jgi:hypothetical protein
MKPHPHYPVLSQKTVVWHCSQAIKLIANNESKTINQEQYFSLRNQSFDIDCHTSICTMIFLKKINFIAVLRSNKTQKWKSILIKAKDDVSGFFTI